MRAQVRLRIGAPMGALREANRPPTPLFTDNSIVLQVKSHSGFTEPLFSAVKISSKKVCHTRTDGREEIPPIPLIRALHTYRTCCLVQL